MKLADIVSTLLASDLPIYVEIHDGHAKSADFEPLWMRANKHDALAMLRSIWGSDDETGFELEFDLTDEPDFRINLRRNGEDD